MKINQLNLPEEALSKLSQLALAVELADRKRFSVRHEVTEVVSLLSYASQSVNTIIHQKFVDFITKLSEEAINLFRAEGVIFGDSLVKQDAGTTHKKFYRGQEVITKAKSEKTKEADPDRAKKKVIYRGKVMYV